jgi:hypothetical protein
MWAVTRFLFEYETEAGEWEVLGTAEGSGEGHLQEALRDLTENERNELAPGRYRYRPDDGETQIAQVFILRTDGRVQLSSLSN